MAGPNINVGTATAYLQVNASGVARGAAQANVALHSLDDVTQNAWWGLRNIGRAALVAGAAIGAAFVFSAKSAIDWEDAMAKVARTTNDSTKSTEQNQAALSKLEDQLRSIVRTTPTDPIEIAGIAEAAGSLGIAQGDIASFTKTVADLAATTNLTADQASTDLARIAALTGIAGGGFENLASDILEVGRSTAATETDITSLAQRIAPIASVVGLTADQIIAFAAALRSAGINSQEGATAFQKTFIDISKAVSLGGEDLATFAQIANMSQEEFKNLFKQDASAAMLKFIQGLGDLNAGGSNVIGMLDSLGIKEARQVKTLLALADAEHQNVNENVKLSHILGVSSDAFEKGTALQEITARQYATTAAQMKILRGQIFELASGFGESFLPVLQIINQTIQAFIIGVKLIPAPIRSALIAAVALTGALLAFIAALGLVLPRIVLVNSALDRMRTSATGAATANAGLAASSAAAGQAAGQQAAATGGAATSSGKFAKAVSGAGKSAGILAALLGVATIAITAFGFANQDAAKEADKLKGSDQGLVDAIRQQAAGTSDAADQWIAYALNAKGAISVLEDMGFTLEDLIKLINGTSDAALAARFADLVNSGQGTEQQREAIKNVVEQAQAYRDASKTAASFNSALKDESDAADQVQQSEKELKKARQDAYDVAKAQFDLTESIAQATIDYVDASANAERQTLDLADAQDKYKSALNKAAHEVDYLRLAQLKLNAALLDATLADFKVADAEKAVSRARQQAAEDLALAELDLKDAQARVIDSNQAVKDAEKALDDLRGQNHLDDIIKATLKLANAQLSLKKANQAVEDSEWLLQHLREEGAGSRDIKEAQLALEEANNNVANSTEDVKDAEKELQKLRENNPEDILKAEQELLKARREAERAAIELTQKERDLDDERADVSANRKQIEASAELNDARISQLEALLQVTDAEQALNEIQNGSLRREAIKAELDLRDAVYQTAKAQAEVIKLQREMNGEFVSNGEFAHILADQLGTMLNIVPDNGTFSKLKEWRNLLYGTTDPGSPPKQDNGSTDTGGIGNFDWKRKANEFNEGAKNFLDETDADNHKEEVKNWADGWASTIIAAAAGIIATIATGNPLIGFITFEFIKSLLDTTGASKAIDDWLQNEWKPMFLAGWEQIKSFFSETWNSITSSIGSFWDLITGKSDIGDPNNQTSFGKNGAFGGMFGDPDELTKEGGDFDNDLKKLAGNIATKIMGLPGLVIGGLGGGLPSIVGTVTGMLFGSGEEEPSGFAEVKQKFTNLGEDIKTTTSDKLGETNGIFNNFTSNLPSFLTPALSPLESIIPGGFEGMLANLGPTKDSVLGLFGGLPGQIQSSLGDQNFLLGPGLSIISGLYGGLNTGWLSMVFPFFTSMPGRIFGFVQTLLAMNPLYSIGVNLIMGLVNGLRSIDIGKVVGDIVKVIPQTMLDLLKIGSPSKVTEEIGKFTSQGLAIGIEGQTKAVKAASEAIVQSAVAPFQDGLDVDQLMRFSQASTSDLSAQMASLVGAAQGGGVVHGDNFNFNIVDTPTAEGLMNEAMWQKRVKNRGSKKGRE